MTTAVAPAIVRTETVPIETLRQHPNNPNNGDLEAIGLSLRAHGQYRALVVNEPTRQVLCGNHTLHALMEMGATEVLVHWVNVNDDEAHRIMLADNRVRDLAWWDKGNLVLQLEELQTNTEAGLEGTGFDAKALDDLRAQIELPITLEPPKFKGTYGETEQEFQARLSRAAPGAGLREIVLLYEAEEHALVVQLITNLKKRWQLTGGNAPTVRRALELAAAGEA